MRAGPGQRPLEDGRSRSRCGDGGAEWGVEEGAALNPRSVCRPEGGLSSGRDLAGGFEEDLPQPTSPRTPLSRDPGDPAWGWEWEGVRSHPLYIRGPRPSEGTPPAQEFALEEPTTAVTAQGNALVLYPAPTVCRAAHAVAQGPEVGPAGARGRPSGDPRVNQSSQSCGQRCPKARVPRYYSPWGGRTGA
ncbi:unnamed protein product [Rangifer tarandus platyrhynchus]|uniref:Uncharacterized protein n=1 Tax=Rangifer tarandus platyrhynchus TaxID=3082113 RepID=A0ABN8ZPG2_RANTA|nr:unnamed protein product [Rangifer tarandus platyrhynchus]